MFGILQEWREKERLQLKEVGKEVIMERIWRMLLEKEKEKISLR